MYTYKKNKYESISKKINAKIKNWKKIEKKTKKLNKRFNIDSIIKYFCFTNSYFIKLINIYYIIWKK